MRRNERVGTPPTIGRRLDVMMPVNRRVGMHGRSISSADAGSVGVTSKGSLMRMMKPEGTWRRHFAENDASFQIVSLPAPFSRFPLQLSRISL
mmetsp:Transcript_96860/g.145086  ORF Transcript_96860/g.145086 Transcript_96860/m.145086 type:complete len:93 (-) Transcript_96860:136-414(-)